MIKMSMLMLMMVKNVMVIIKSSFERARLLGRRKGIFSQTAIEALDIISTTIVPRKPNHH